jgi:hypothetical protein
MGKSRLELSAVLNAVCPNVYFQPPASVQMQYPAIVYELARADTQFADDRPYNVTKQYSLQLISEDPDESIFDALAALPLCAHERHFVADNLNHEVFNIYF